MARTDSLVFPFWYSTASKKAWFWLKDACFSIHCWVSKCPIFDTFDWKEFIASWQKFCKPVTCVSQSGLHKHLLDWRRRMFATNIFVTRACSWRQTNLSTYKFVTNFIFVTKWILVSRSFVSKLSRHEVPFHLYIENS